MEKVFGYVRVSTETQAKSGYGAESQENAIRDYCIKNDLELENIFYDLGVSGTSVDREGLTDLISTFNGITKVVVLNTSRLWRSDTAKVLIKRQLEKVKSEVLSIEQPTYSIYTKDPNDFLINGMMELLDQYERMTINLKLARGRRQKVKSGVKGCGEVPLGYRWKKEGVKKPIVVIDEESADIVKEIFSKYLELKSIGKVMKYLDGKEYKTKRGNSFSAQTVSNILSNSFYKGEVNHANLSVKGQHETLISPITFGKVQAMLERNIRNKVHKEA